MLSLISKLLRWLRPKPKKSEYQDVWQAEWSAFLAKKVSFYKNLNRSEQEVFERRVLLFLHSTAIEGSAGVDVSAEDCLLVAASAIIPVWNFPKWHYFNLKSVYLLPAAFNDSFECGQDDSVCTGMVGTGPMHGKMALSKPHLHLGFSNDRDKQNVGIHEFVHLIDMADGECDGFPEHLIGHEHAIPWFDFVRHKIDEIENNDSNIRDYGATNSAEFFSVASEYFFERPSMLKKKHPKLCALLEEFYRQNVEDIASELKVAKNALCPCGSQKKYKRCCLNLQ